MQIYVLDVPVSFEVYYPVYFLSGQKNTFIFGKR